MGAPGTAQGSSGVPTCLPPPAPTWRPALLPSPTRRPGRVIKPSRPGGGRLGGEWLPLASSFCPPNRRGGVAWSVSVGRGGLVLKLSNVGEGQWTRLDTGREMCPQHFFGPVGRSPPVLQGTGSGGLGAALLPLRTDCIGHSPVLWPRRGSLCPETPAPAGYRGPLGTCAIPFPTGATHLPPPHCPFTRRPDESSRGSGEKAGGPLSPP